MPTSTAPRLPPPARTNAVGPASGMPTPLLECDFDPDQGHDARPNALVVRRYGDVPHAEDRVPPEVHAAADGDVVVARLPGVDPEDRRAAATRARDADLARRDDAP